jgi:SAM-dependent methyltransferase
MDTSTSRLESQTRRTAHREPYAELTAFFDAFAPREQRWRHRNGTYHRLLECVYRFQIPRGASVLEIGSGSGDLLAALAPTDGVGVDISPGMTDLARERHPELEFVCELGEDVELGRTFDYVVLSDLTPFVHDLLALFENVARHSHPGTRVIVNSYSTFWRPSLAVAERLGLKPRKPVRNWISPGDVRNLLDLAGFETLTSARRILLPKQVPFVTFVLNGLLANTWPFGALCLTWWIVGRPRPLPPVGDRSVSVVCPCRNEQGHIAGIMDRLPAFGSAVELVFVEGNSTDDTRGEIERQIAARPDIDARLVLQPGKGKGDAVRAGFDAARHDVLLILDGDLSVNPEDLPKFYRALVDGHGDLINGSRLVYDMEPGAMRLLNMLGNQVFSRLFRSITGYHVKDTLCGTKVLFRENYALIAHERSHFGDFDPFGDFDLLFGAARLNRKIIDLPVRYQPRTYGDTNISRFRHGLLLLRMTVFAFWKFRLALFRHAS